MKTDDLIAMLSADVAPVDHRWTTRSLATAVALGAAATLILVIVALGVRAHLTDAGVFVPLLLKIGVLIAVLVPASVYLARVVRPGGERGTPLGLVALPFVGVVLLAAVSLGFAPRAHWDRMVMGDQWVECLVSIPLIAIVPFAVIVWVVRRSAPTDLRRAGALVGLVAGCVSAVGYALHCVDDTVPFVALWYGGTIALCTLAGWALGPRLLRW